MGRGPNIDKRPIRDRAITALGKGHPEFADHAPAIIDTLMSGGFIVESLEARRYDEHLIKNKDALPYTRGWVKYLSARGLSENTIRTYLSGLTAFLNSGHDLSSPGLQQFVLEQQEIGLSSATIAARVVHTREYAKWLAQEGHIDKNPLMSFRVPKATNKKRPSLSDAQVSKFVGAVFDVEITPMNRLDVLQARAAVMLLTTTGARREELVTLGWERVNLEAGIILVHGKGGKSREIPLTGKTVDALREWKSIIHDQLGSPWVLPNSADLGEHRQTRNFWHLLKPFAEQVGLHVSPHDFRHYAATRMLSRGMNMRLVQEFLGHSSIATTQRYTHVAWNELREAHRRAMDDDAA